MVAFSVSGRGSVGMVNRLLWMWETWSRKARGVVVVMFMFCAVLPMVSVRARCWCGARGFGGLGSGMVRGGLGCRVSFAIV